MQDKHKKAKILSTISISIIAVLVLLVLIAPTGFEYFSKIAILTNSIVPLTVSSLLTIIALFLNKKQVLGWLSLVFNIAFFLVAIYYIVLMSRLFC